MNISNPLSLLCFLASLPLVGPALAQTTYPYKQIGEFKTRDANLWHHDIQPGKW